MFLRYLTHIRTLSRASMVPRGLYFLPQAIFIPPLSDNYIFPPLATRHFFTPIMAFLPYRNSVTRFFVSGFFQQTTSPGPNRHAQEQFRIFSNIRGFIRIRNRLPGDEYTGEAIRIL
jgi:hypothetical protein